LIFGIIIRQENLSPMGRIKKNNLMNEKSLIEEKKEENIKLKLAENNQRCAQEISTILAKYNCQLNITHNIEIITKTN
jgi:hypothetical protein